MAWASSPRSALGRPARGAAFAGDTAPICHNSQDLPRQLLDLPHLDRAVLQMRMVFRAAHSFFVICRLDQVVSAQELLRFAVGPVGDQRLGAADDLAAV